MSLDAYSPCPGGLGKKVKFCCSDLVQDLAKIDRMRQGNQSLACLDLVQRLDARHPGRACLMAAKADLLRELGRKEEANSVLQGLMESSGENPVALSEAAILACEQGEVESAVVLLHEAIDALPEHNAWGDPMIKAFAAVTNALLNSGLWLPARLQLQVMRALSGKDAGIEQLLRSMFQSPSVSPFMKSVGDTMEFQENTPWQEEYNQYISLGRQVRLLAAIDGLSALADKGIDVPQLWYSLAVLQARICDNASAAANFLKYAACDVPLDDAVDAAGAAQVLDEDADLVQTTCITYPIVDYDRFLEICLSEPRLRTVPELPPGDEDSPPPLAAFRVLDRPPVAFHADLQVDQLPIVQGSMLFYGRQTDRDARLELFCEQPGLKAAQALLAQLGFGLLGAPDAGKLVQVQPLDDSLLELDRLIPADMPLDVRQEFTTALASKAVFEQWPRTPRDSLDGQSPAQAAANPKNQVKVLAAVLNLQFECETRLHNFDFNQLRSQLGLPLPSAIAVENIPFVEMKPTRLWRVALSPLSPKQLKEMLAVSEIFGLFGAQRLACQELLSRTEGVQPMDRAVAHRALVRLSSNSREALEHVDKGREWAVSARQSSGQWDLLEVQVRLSRGEVEHFDRLIKHLMTEHKDEPDVREAVFRLLVDLGLMHPDGRPMHAAQAEAAMPMAAAAEPGKLWTPESVQTGERKALWVPD